ncbi:MAG: ZPR1 zinc finger domain-containing protein [Promethearchaeota archaeon]
MSEKYLSVSDGEKCPVCNYSTMKVTTREIDIPHFGQTLLYSSLCRNCGFRQSWSYPLEESSPHRYTLYVSDPSDLTSRVIKSNTASIKIPELGFSMESKMSSDPFISNVEGVLQRAKSATQTLNSWADSKEEKEKIKRLLLDIDRAIAGELHFTLIIEDPLGISTIEAQDPKKLKIEEISLSEDAK